MVVIESLRSPCAPEKSLLFLVGYVGFGNDQRHGPCTAGALNSDPGWVRQVSSQDQQRALQGDFSTNLLLHKRSRARCYRQSPTDCLQVGILEKLTEVEQMLANKRGRVIHSTCLVGSLVGRAEN